MNPSGIWYKIKHPWFSPEWAYQAIHFAQFSETAWAQITFILPTGHTVSVQNYRCTALPRACERRYVNNHQLSREQTETEKLFPWANKLPSANPDLNTDIQ